MRSPIDNDAVAQPTPSSTRVPGPIQLLSTPYLNRNAAPISSVNTATRLTQFRPRRVSMVVAPALTGGAGTGAAEIIGGGPKGPAPPVRGGGEEGGNPARKGGGAKHASGRAPPPPKA